MRLVSRSERVETTNGSKEMSGTTSNSSSFKESMCTFIRSREALELASLNMFTLPSIRSNTYCEVKFANASFLAMIRKPPDAVLTRGENHNE